MAKEWARIFYNSKQWKQCRESYIKERIRIDGGLCEQCHQNPGYMLHHKVILTKENISNPDVTLNWELLNWECKSCHDREEGHFINKKTGTLCKFDKDGQPVSLREVDIPP